MANLLKERTYQLIYDYFKDIEFAYDTLKDIHGKTINQLSVEQYDYLNSCEARDCKIDTANNICTEKYSFFKEIGHFACRCLESLGVCTLFLPYEAIYIERTGSIDDMDSATLKCNLLNINNYIEEVKGILLMLGFHL